MNRKVTTRNVSVNVAKVITIAVLLALPLFYAVHTRQAAYLAMHVGYCVWYLLKQAIMREPVFRERDSLFEVVQVVATVGVFYALPGWLAFTNTEPLNDAILAGSIVLFFFGSVVNSGADIEKATTLRLREGLITGGFWRLSRNINYFGDLMRYSAFALLSGSPWSWTVVATVLVIDIDRIRKKERSLARFPEWASYRESVAPLVPFLAPFGNRGPRASGEARAPGVSQRPAERPRAPTP